MEITSGGGELVWTTAEGDYVFNASNGKNTTVITFTYVQNAIPVTGNTLTISDRLSAGTPTTATRIRVHHPQPFGYPAMVAGRCSRFVAQEGAVPGVGRLRDAPLRRVVDVHQAEAGAVPLGPLEVVHQRPHEVAADVDAGVDRLADGGDVAAQVLHALRSVDVRRGLLHQLVGERRTALGDHDRRERVAVALVDAHEDVAQAVGTTGQPMSVCSNSSIATSSNGKRVALPRSA